MKVDTLFFGDIDGCFVKGFNAGNLNHAAYIEQLKQQPINQLILNRFKKVFHKFHVDIKKKRWIVEFATGRKKSEVESLTLTQLADINHYIKNIHFYPEELGYDPYSIYVDWKINKLIECIAKYKPRSTIVLEDSIEIINTIAKTLPNLSIEYLFVVKDRYIISPNVLEDCEVSA